MHDHDAGPPALHLSCPGGSASRFISELGFQDASALIDEVQETVGDPFAVTGDPALIGAAENPQRGGRIDDAARVADLERTFSDDRVRGLVTLRGGSWFTRVIPAVRFDLLEQRRQPLHVFGFSEMTTLVNIVGGYPGVTGILDMGPAFLSYGLGRQGTADAATVREALRRYFKDVVSILCGRGSERALRTLVRGRLDSFPKTVRLVGGNLAVLTTLTGSPHWARIMSGHEDRAEPTWLVLEDFNEQCFRLDRYLSHLTLADTWRHIDGLLLGDFHLDEQDQRDAVLAMLPHHLGNRNPMPVLACDTVGHRLPMSPLPVNTPVRIIAGEPMITLEPAWTEGESG